MEMLVESAVRATVLAAAVALLLRAFGLASPRIRHRAWASVAGVMLVLPFVVAWGPEAPIRVLRSQASFAASDSQPAPIAKDVEAAPPAAPVTQQSPSQLDWRTIVALDWRDLVALLYAGVFAFLILRLGFGVRRARAIVREAELVNGRLTHPGCTSPVTVGLLAPVVVLPRNWPEWTDAELAAVLAHEEEHVRRRDPLISFVTVLNRSVFWFHPLAWWLQRRVSTLSEQACDEAVLLQGHDPEVYCESLLKFARSVSDAGSRVAFVGTGMPGTDLQARLLVLAQPPVAPPPLRRLACLAAAYAGAVAIIAAATPAPSSAPASGAPSQVRAGQTQASGSEWLVETSEHFEIFYERPQASRIGDVKQKAEEAYAHVSGQLKYDLVERVTMILVRRNGDLDDGVARANVVAASGDPTRQRIVISTESLDTRAGAIVHELSHHFAFEIIPRASAAAQGLVEGVAEHHRGLWDAGDYRRLHDDLVAGRIPGLDGLTSSDRHWGHALFDFITSQYGAEGGRRFLFALRGRPQPTAAIPVAFDLPADEFVQSFRAYVAVRFGAQ